MNKKRSLVKWLGGYKKKQKKSEKPETNNQKFRVKSRFHRGYYIENSTEDINKWKARVNGQFITGNLESIKESIDWWCDKNEVLLPETFTTSKLPKKIKNRKVKVYRGFKLLNDTGEHHEWYILYKGKLIKGSKEGIEIMIDRAYYRQKNKLTVIQEVDD